MKRTTTRSMFFFGAISLLCSIIFTLIYIGTNRPTVSTHAPTHLSETHVQPISTASPPPTPTTSYPQITPLVKRSPQIQKVTVSAVGDVMMHGPQIRSGAIADQQYDFTSFFTGVESYITQADLSVANLELTVSESGPFTGYPRFRAPTQILDALKGAGFDILFTANNHSMDNGVTGVTYTWEQIRQRGLLPVGTSPTVDQARPSIISVNGVDIGFSTYTYGTNGIPVPADQEHLVNLIDLPKIEQDLAYLDQMDVDFKIVGLHFGQEYQRTPSDHQLEMVTWLNSLDVDVVIGSHPHVLQSTEWIIGPKHKTLVIYSLGNFISNQKDPFTDIGAILQFTLVKNNDTYRTSVEKVSLIPTTVIRSYEEGKLRYRVLPLEDVVTNTEQYKKATKPAAYYQSMWIEIMNMFGPLADPD